MPSGGGAASAAPAAAAAAPAAKEEPKKKESEDEDGDMGFGLFDQKYEKFFVWFHDDLSVANCNGTNTHQSRARKRKKDIK